MRTYSYTLKANEIYENNIKQEDLEPQDLPTLKNLEYDAKHSRFEWEGQEVRLTRSEWVITEQGTNRVLFRATSPGHALRWLLNLI